MMVEERFKLLFGPYEPPRIPRNHRLLCEMRDYLRVGGYSNALIPWPKRYRANSIILCGELVRAVKMESVDAVCYHWGVCRNVVQRWRHALGVPEINPGTQWLKRMLRREMNQEARERATLRADNPEATVKSKLPPHERAHPLVRIANSRLLKERFARTGRHTNPELRLWSAKEEKKLGTARDEEVARKLKRSTGAVRVRRCQLGIRAWSYRYGRPWTPEEEALLGKIPDDGLARKLKRPFDGVQARRERKGLPPVNPVRHVYTAEDEALLGTMPDEEAARRIGVSVQAAAAHRVGLKIRIYNPRLHQWTAAEDGLLGTRPDKELAKRLSISKQAVAHRRRRLGIAAYVEVREWREEELKLIGKVPDREASRLLRRTVRAVRVKRREMGIRFPNPRYQKWDEKDFALLGQVTDVEVARRTGHSLPSVRWVRKCRGIPAKPGRPKRG